MNEIAVRQDSLTGQMKYAEVIAHSTIIPVPYRRKPADILVAMQLGAAMGLSPAESLYRIDVIQGKPTAAAELIASNVRKAGHLLRLTVDESRTSATCTIVRADDPDFEHTVTRDESWAKRMGLLGKDNYQKQPTTMLGWRAVTACARMACPEALYGVGYTPDEMAETKSYRPVVGGLAGVLAAKAETETTDDPPVDVETGEVIDAEPDPEPARLDTGSNLAKAMFAAMNEQGFKDRESRLEVCTSITGRDITSSADLTEVEAQMILSTLTTKDGDQS